jgi:hypothetical protein
MTQHDRISVYLRGLARLCAKVAARPELLPTFLRVLALVPGTVRELLRRELRRAA